MPKVGKKNYSYTKKGREDAQKASKRSGKPVKYQRKSK